MLINIEKTNLFGFLMTFDIIKNIIISLYNI